MRRFPCKRGYPHRVTFTDTHSKTLFGRPCKRMSLSKSSPRQLLVVLPVASHSQMLPSMPPLATVFASGAHAKQSTQLLCIWSGTEEVGKDTIMNRKLGTAACRRRT